ncbi:MAG: tetratricopeptide repeat protein [Pseudomonadales bacterium]
MRTVRVFISSPADVAVERVVSRGVVDRLQGEFAGHFALEMVFWEYEPLLATADFQSQIPSPADCDVFIAVLWSRLGSALPDMFTRPDGTRFASGTEYEFETALAAQRAGGRPEILVYRKTSPATVVLDDEDRLLAEIEQKRALDRFVEKWFSGDGAAADHAYHRFDTPERFEELLESHLRKLLGKRVETSSPPSRRAAAWQRGSPFRGLSAFEFEHAPVFFGRTRAITEVLSALGHQAESGRAFVLILGMSGVGKSSLVRAGLLSMLTRPGVVPGINRWARAVLSPSDAASDPIASLSRALLTPQALPGIAETLNPEALADQLLAMPEGIVPLLKHTLDGGRARLVLVVDQLEELFTHGQSIEDARAFVRALTALATSGAVWVIATLRSDFYPRCEAVPELMTLKEGLGQYDLAPPTPDEISQMIRLPAQAAGLEFEENPTTGARLDDVLRDHACANPDMLPLLEFTLEELYQRRSPDGRLTFAAYAEIGGVEGSIARRAEHVFDGLPADAKAQFQRTLDHLVAQRDGKQGGTRRRARVDELQPEARSLVDAFVNARLFVTELDDQERGVVRIAHESLIEHWPRIRRWLAANEENLQLHARLTDALERWRADPTPDLLLPEGKPLEEAHLLQRRGIDLTPEERTYIAASDRRTRRSRSIRMSLVGALVLLTIAAAIGAGVAIEQRQIARTEASTAAATTEFLVELFQVADPWAVARAPGGEITVRQALDLGADRAMAALADQPRVQANFVHAIGSVYQGLGLSDQARPLLERALANRRELLGDRHPDVAESLHALAFVAEQQGRFETAEAQLRESIDIWSTADGPGSLARALAMNLLSITLASLDRYDEAIRVQQEAIDIQESHPEVGVTDLANAYNNLGYVLMNADRYRESRDALLKAVEVSTDANANGLRARALANLAAAYQVLGDLPRARALHEQALDLKRAWFESGHPEIGYSLNNLAWVVREQGNYAEATELYEEAIDNFTGALGPNHLNVAVVRGNLARTLLEAGQPKRAIELFDASLQQIHASAGDASSYTLPIHVGLGGSYEILGNATMAERHYRQTIEIAEKLNPEAWDLGIALGRIAALTGASLSDAERDAAFTRAIAVLARSGGHNNLSVASVMVDFARHLDATGRFGRARDLFSEALDVERASLEPNDPTLLEHLTEFESRFGAAPAADPQGT